MLPAARGCPMTDLPFADYLEQLLKDRGAAKVRPVIESRVTYEHTLPPHRRLATGQTLRRD